MLKNALISQFPSENFPLSLLTPKDDLSFVYKHAEISVLARPAPNLCDRYVTSPHNRITRACCLKRHHFTFIDSIDSCEVPLSIQIVRRQNNELLSRRGPGIAFKQSPPAATSWVLTQQVT